MLNDIQTAILACIFFSFIAVTYFVWTAKNIKVPWLKSIGLVVYGVSIVVVIIYLLYLMLQIYCESGCIPLINLSHLSLCSHLIK